MPTSTKQTSLQRLTAALTEHGWQFTTEETTVKVPDKENPYRKQTYSSRNHYPLKSVPAVKVKASNGTKSDPKHFSATFTAEGAYLSDKTTGSYPFSYYTALKAVLPNIEKNSATALETRAEAEESKKVAQQAEEEQRVAEAFAAASEAEQAAKAAAVSYLRQEFGLAENQSESLLSAMNAKESPLAEFAVAKEARERVGKGWLPGKTFLRGTYVDGKRVG
jgi:hypothetical protein